MTKLFSFPLRARHSLISSIADDLDRLHGQKANEFWRQRIAGIVAELRDRGLEPSAIREEILDLQWAVQNEMQQRVHCRAEAAG